METKIIITVQSELDAHTIKCLVEKNLKESVIPRISNDGEATCTVDIQTQDSEYESVSGYAMVNVSGHNGYSMMCKTDEDDEDAIIDMLVLLGQIDKEDAEYAVVDFDLTQHDVNHFGVYDLDEAWKVRQSNN